MRTWLRLMAATQGTLFIAAIAVTGQNFQGTEAGSQGDALIQKGRQLFLANCAMCHGINAQSPCPMVPSLIGVTERMSPSEIIAHSRGLANSMCCARHLAQLSDSDYHSIIAYLRTLKPTAAVPHQPTATMPMGKPGCPMMGGMTHSDGHANHSHRHQPEPTKPPSLFPQTRRVENLTITFALQPDPPRVGDNTVQVRLTDTQGQPVTDAKVQVQFSMPSMQMVGPTILLRLGKDGTYLGSAVLGMEGAWRAEVTVQRSSKKPVSVPFDFLVPVARSQERSQIKQPSSQTATHHKGCCAP